MGIHRIHPGTKAEIDEIIITGSKQLNITIDDSQKIFEESRGDYWLTQQLCRTICNSQNVDATQLEHVHITWNADSVIERVVGSLMHGYDPTVRSFCRGRRFRPTNDPYFKLLRCVSQQSRSSVDLNELANANPDVKGSINNVKDHRLSVLISEKQDCSKFFYYDNATKNFAIEDPALFFYIKHLNWDSLRERCGFRDSEKDFEFDIAISFAGENRDLAEFIANQLSELDISVFYDRNYEDNYLGGPWSKYFNEIFVEKSRLVAVLLDKHHLDKVWPTFERDCFSPRVKSQEVIPIHLDETVFPGIPNDLVSIHFRSTKDISDQRDDIIDNIVMRIAIKLQNL